ncbi:hypothetical protein NPS46_06070 [Pseudomonas putida]|nr:hypothetical protein [Pseudomonas putida]MDD2052112.1 hypothetical protein [Pseudomonas putida]
MRVVKALLLPLLLILSMIGVDKLHVGGTFQPQAAPPGLSR